MEKQTLGKHERIRKRKQYLIIYQQGERSYSENFTTIVCQNQLGTKRLGTTASKKIGGAVKRNRTKRLIREFFRLNKFKLSASHDFVIIVKRDISSLTYQDVCRELGSLLFKKADAK
ncbi:MAG: ribonuclease P protein component [Syntrophales bacterium]|nr:ribonuclease P protein component [Syntrophales bacterium]